ncbi:inhibitor of apoptosis protein [Biomphalaria glabrata]|nr:inhibitor of apoptosis protein [Biomphalaria glabrata]
MPNVLVSFSFVLILCNAFNSSSKLAVPAMIGILSLPLPVTIAQLEDIFL